MKKIGVLALQGDFNAHCRAIDRTGSTAIEVRSLKDLDKIDGLIIPGGESTVIYKLLIEFNIIEELKKKIHSGLAVFGTCAGLILLAKNIENDINNCIGVLDITIKRNAYGRQIFSFSEEIETILPGLNRIKAVFIRAPIITKLSKKVEILAKHRAYPVLVRQKNILACSFHPELIENENLHKWFIDNFIKL